MKTAVLHHPEIQALAKAKTQPGTSFFVKRVHISEREFFDQVLRAALYMRGLGAVIQIESNPEEQVEFFVSMEENWPVIFHPEAAVCYPVRHCASDEVYNGADPMPYERSFWSEYYGINEYTEEIVKEIRDGVYPFLELVSREDYDVVLEF